MPQGHASYLRLPDLLLIFLFCPNLVDIMSRRRKQRDEHLQSGDAVGSHFVRALGISAAISIGAFAAYHSLGSDVPIYTADHKGGLSSIVSTASSPNPSAINVSKVTLGEARNDPSKRQPYIDSICRESGVNGVYDPDGLKYASRLSKLEIECLQNDPGVVKMDLQAVVRETLKRSGAVVPTAMCAYGRGYKENVYVFPRLFLYGFKICDLHVVPVDSVGEGCVFAVQSDDDARALIRGHEGSHLKDVDAGYIFRGQRLDPGFLELCRRQPDDFFLLSGELKAYIRQLAGYSGKMSLPLFMQTVGEARYVANKMLSAKIADPRLRDFVNQTGEDGLRELSSYQILGLDIRR